MKYALYDLPDAFNRDIDYEIALIREAFPDCRVITVKQTGDVKRDAANLEGVDGVVTGYGDFTAELMKRVPGLKMISEMGTGYNNIDVEAATKLGIKVSHVREYCTTEVAEHTLALILALARNLKRYQYSIEKYKEWKYDDVDTIRLSGMTMGIFGFGRIGKAVAARAKAFGMQIMAYDPYLTFEIAKEYGIRSATEQEVLEQADIITNHMILTEETTDYFNRERFSKMKRTPIFINVARGRSVVEEDLKQALQERWISGAGLDVLSSEEPDLNCCSFLNNDRVILTPHSAFYSAQSMRDLQRLSVQNMIYFFQGDTDKMYAALN